MLLVQGFAHPGEGTERQADHERFGTIRQQR